MNDLYVGTIEGIFGYGIAVVADTKAECRKAMKAEYHRWKRMIERDTRVHPLSDNMNTFDKAFEYFGGWIRKVKKGKAYNDNFH
jgi:hypothetical protein